MGPKRPVDYKKAVKGILRSMQSPSNPKISYSGVLAHLKKRGIPDIRDERVQKELYNHGLHYIVLEWKLKEAMAEPGISERARKTREAVESVLKSDSQKIVQERVREVLQRLNVMDEPRR